MAFNLLPLLWIDKNSISSYSKVANFSDFFEVSFLFSSFTIGLFEEIVDNFGLRVSRYCTYANLPLFHFILPWQHQKHWKEYLLKFVLLWRWIFPICIGIYKNTYKIWYKKWAVENYFFALCVLISDSLLLSFLFLNNPTENHPSPPGCPSSYISGVPRTSSKGICISIRILNLNFFYFEKNFVLKTPPIIAPRKCSAIREKQN